MTTPAAGTPPAGQPGTPAPAEGTPAAPAEGTPAAGTPPAEGTPAPAEGASALTPGDNQDPADPAAQKPADAAGEVEVTLPEGVELDDAAVKEFAKSAKEWGLNSEQASKAAGFYVSQLQAQETEFTKLNEGWEKTLKTHEEFGGEKYEQSTALMRRVVEEVGGKELVEDINNYRLGNLPSLVNFIWKARSLVQEGSSIVKGAPTSGELTADQELRRDYPSMYNEDGTPIKK